MPCPGLSHGNFMAKRQLNRRQNWRIEKIQGERAARAAKREQHALQELEGGDLGPEQLGLVIAHFGVQVEVEAQDGETAGQVFRCHLRANLPALVTGDRVVWRAGNQGIGVIVAQMPRSTELCRPNNHGQLKPVAANGRGEREINPVKVNLALYQGDKKVGDVKPVALERGEAAVLYVTGSGSALSPVWVTRPVASN